LELTLRNIFWRGGTCVKAYVSAQRALPVVVGRPEMPVGPQQGAAQKVHQLLEAVLDATTLVIGCVFVIISAAPLMIAFCGGQDLDALSASISVLHAYPCEGSAIARTAFLARSSPRILKNVLCIRGQDVWLAAFLSFWLLRVASRICLPPRLYSHIVAPLLTFAARAAPLVLLLAAGRRSPLSSTASQFVFRSQGFFDAIVSVMQPTSFAHAEVLFNILSVVAVGLLASWHGHSNAVGISVGGGDVDASDSTGGSNGNDGDGDGGNAATAAWVFVAQVVLQRAVLMLAVHWLVGRFFRRRHGPRALVGLQTSPPQVSAAATVAAPTSPASSAHCQRQQLQGHLDSQQPRPEAEDPASSDQRRDRLLGCGHCTGNCCQQVLQMLAHAAAGAAGTPAAAVEAGTGSIVAGPATAVQDEGTKNMVPDLATVANGRAVCGAVSTTLTIPYKSPIRRRTARIKIPFAEPEDIAPGYVERLQALVAQRGMHLSGVYVRPGCIELLMDLEMDARQMYDAARHSSAAAPHIPEGRELQSADCAAFANGDGSGHCCAAAAAAAAAPAVGDIHLVDPCRICHHAVSLASDIDGVLWALGVNASTAIFGGKLTASATADVTVISLDEAAVQHPGGGVTPQPRVLQLSPRVLMRPPPPPPCPPNLAPCEAVVAELSVTVSYADASAGGNDRDACGNHAEMSTTRALPEVLIRSQGLYLRSRAALRSGSAGGGDGGSLTSSYKVDLLELPPYPGLALIELRLGRTLSPAIPLLILDDPAVAVELESATAWVNTAAAAAAGSSFSGRSTDRSLDDFLWDLGAWLTHSAVASNVRATYASRAAELCLRMPYDTADALALHLISYAEACGWTATANCIRKRAVIAASAEGADAIVATAATAATDVATEATNPDTGYCWPPPPPGPQSHPRPLLLVALLQAIGWCALPPKDEAAYAVYAAPRVFAYGHVIQAMEVLSLIALLFRARNQLLDPGNLTTIVGCAMGTLTAAAWPLLPHRRWEALVNAVKIPRYFAYVTAKLMIGWLGFPAPPGIVPYQMGYAMLVMEGVLMPFSCLLSPRAALILALIKFPFAIEMMLASGATADPVRAVVLCFRVVLAAVATTIACHTYLRYSYIAWVAAPSARSGPGMLAAEAMAAAVIAATKDDTAAGASASRPCFKSIIESTD
ncbi:hypothetical protein Vretifemale_11084, partial [Volvox reticuliferus]